MVPCNNGFFSYLAEMENLQKKRMKKKFELEYILNTSLGVLFDRLATPGGLAEWFADDVNIDGDILTFFWENNQEQAEILNLKDNKMIRMKWLDDTFAKSYLEFKVGQDELTGDTSLYITDFAEEGEIKEAISLWNSQVSELKRALGL